MHIYINRGGLKAYICILGQHSNIIVCKDIFILIVAEFSLFGGPLTKKQYLEDIIYINY